MEYAQWIRYAGIAYILRSSIITIVVSFGKEGRGEMSDRLKSSFTGRCRVFRREKDDGKVTYSTSLSNKNAEGNWENGWILLRFPKDTIIQDKTDINLTKAWLSFFLTKEGKAIFYIFVQEFNQDTQEAIPEGFQALEDEEDVPF